MVTFANSGTLGSRTDSVQMSGRIVYGKISQWEINLQAKLPSLFYLTSGEGKETQRWILMTGRRVVIADDFGPMLSEVARLLQGSFEIVGTATDGHSALDTTMALNPDLVVLDVSMPGMSGIEVAKELKKRQNSAKIVFLTVHKDSNILATCLAVGGRGYVDKVLLDKDLIPAMNEALAGRIYVSRYSQKGH
jgi:CheY-like chemotaxis protein